MGTPKIKITFCFTCIRPILKYACHVWDPIQAKSIEWFEKTQNTAAWFVLGRYRMRDSCTVMKAEL